MKNSIDIISWLLILLVFMQGRKSGALEARNGTVIIIAANDYEVSTDFGFFIEGSAEYIVTNTHVINGINSASSVIDENDLGKYTLDIAVIDEHKDIDILRSNIPINGMKNLFMSLEPRYYLFEVGGYFSGSHFVLYGKTLGFLGRDMFRCNLVFLEDAKRISGVHCQLSTMDKKLYLIDLGSRNGTFLSTGKRLVF